MASFDRRHRAHLLPYIPDGTDVWITTDRADPIPGIVVGKATTPRSYLVETEGGAVRHNRRQLNVVPSSVEQTEEKPVVPQQQDQNLVGENGHPSCPSPPRRIMTRSQTGTVIRPPHCFVIHYIHVCIIMNNFLCTKLYNPGMHPIMEMWLHT